MGALLGVVGNAWVEFYVRYLSMPWESWAFSLSFSLSMLALIGLCVFLTAVQLFRGAESLNIRKKIGVDRHYKIGVPQRLASQLGIGPGDHVAFSLDQNKLVMEKRG